MDKRKSVLNISVSIVSRMILLVAALLVRRLLIQHIGNDVNGLNSLYASIIGMLSVAELGIGSAIVFSMYSPIVKGEKHHVAALFCLYRKLYRIIGAIIFGAGMIVMPFLPRLIEDYEILNVNVYGTFFLTLISVVLSYLYSAKTSLIEAHKDNYLTTAILTIASLVRYVLQAVAILVWASYTFFILCEIIQTLAIWFVTEMVVRRRYGDIIILHEVVDPSTKQGIVRNVKAMFLHKIGTIVVNGIDSLVISGFIGVVALGKYMNYTIIATSMTSIIALFFTSLTSVIGHLCVGHEPSRIKGVFNHFYCMNYILGIFFFLGYYAVIDYVVAVCFGPDLEEDRIISLIITLNYFIQYMRKATLLFRNASGSFYYDRWRTIAESAINLTLSILFVDIFPTGYRVVGVIVATIITNLLICHVVEPYVLFRHVFNQSPRRFYLKNYAYIAVFTLGLIVMTKIIQPCDRNIIGFLRDGFLSVGVSLVLIGIVIMIDRDFRSEVWTMGRKAINWIVQKRAIK